MAIAPLHHLVTDLYQPNRQVPEILQEKIASFKTKACLYNTLEKTCYVALFAILLAVFAVSYNLIAATGALPMVIVGLVLLSPVLILAPSQLSQSARFYARLAEEETEVCLRYRCIENWTLPQVELFMRENGLQPDRLPWDSLRAVSSNESWKLLLPLIARFQRLKHKADWLREEDRNALSHLEGHFARLEQEGRGVKAQEKQKLRFETKVTWAQRLEREGIPAALQAAVLLEILQNPTLTGIDLSPELKLPGLGTFFLMPYSEREFCKTHTPKEDHYLIFNPEQQRAPLSHQAILNCEMNPAALRALLSQEGVRV